MYMRAISKVVSQQNGSYTGIMRFLGISHQGSESLHVLYLTSTQPSASVIATCGRGPTLCASFSEIDPLSCTIANVHEVLRVVKLRMVFVARVGAKELTHMHLRYIYLF
jgi:hypothetical protein